MKSASAMTINSESTLSEIVSSNVTRTTGGTHTHSIQIGEHTIDYNGDAVFITYSFVTMIGRMYYKTHW